MNPQELLSLKVITTRLCLAMFAGAILGIERECKNQPAGFRTYMLVCIGSSLIMLANQYLYLQNGTGDPARIGAQVVSGIGFLGAGTIIITRNNIVRGLTTAAGLWVAAGLGLTIGIGFYQAALIALILILFIMTIMQRLDALIKSYSKTLHLYLEYDNDLQMPHLINIVRTMKGEISEIYQDSPQGRILGSHSMNLSLKLEKHTNHQKLITTLTHTPGILYLAEIRSPI